MHCNYVRWVAGSSSETRMLLTNTVHNCTKLHVVSDDSARIHNHNNNIIIHRVLQDVGDLCALDMLRNALRAPRSTFAAFTLRCTLHNLIQPESRLKSENSNSWITYWHWSGVRMPNTTSNNEFKRRLLATLQLYIEPKSLLVSENIFRKPIWINLFFVNVHYVCAGLLDPVQNYVLATQH